MQISVHRLQNGARWVEKTPFCERYTLVCMDLPLEELYCKVVNSNYLAWNFEVEFQMSAILLSMPREWQISHDFSHGVRERSERLKNNRKYPLN